MKTASIATTLLLAATVSFAQKVEEQPVEFNYVQLPETPLDPSITGYQGIIVQNHEQRVAEMKQASEQERQRIEYDHQQALAGWETAKAEIDAKYEADLAAYNSKSAGNKILENAFLNETKPVKPPYPSMPYKPPFIEPYYPKVYNSSSLATYAGIAGMKKNTGNDVIITITMDGFELGGVENRMNETSKKDAKTGAVTKIQTHWKEANYKHGMAVRVESAATGVIMDEYIDAFSNFQTGKTNNYRSAYELENYWRQNEKSFLNKKDDEITMAHLKDIRNILDNRYGHLTIARGTNVRTVKPKKFDYSDIQGAYENALIGYNAIEKGGMEKTEAKASLNKSIEAWEAVVAEYDPNVKKARISEKIMIAMRMNLIEAYIFTDDYTKAKMHYNKLVALGNKKAKREADGLNDFLENQKMRYNANQG